LSERFLIKNGLKRSDVLSLLPLIFTLRYAVRMVQLNQDDLKLEVHISFWFMLMMLICWEGAYIPYRNTETLVFDSKATGLEVSADRTKYVIMSRDQNA
jgi:hypothetical protein